MCSQNWQKFYAVIEKKRSKFRETEQRASKFDKKETNKIPKKQRANSISTYSIWDGGFWYSFNPVPERITKFS